MHTTYNFDNYNKKLSYCRHSTQYGNGHSSSSVVVPINATYAILLALNRNLTSMINISWDIMPSLHLHIPHLSSRCNWKKTAEIRWTCFGVRVPRILDYPTINLNLRQSAPYDRNSRPSQIDRRMNIMATVRRFVLMNASCAKNRKLLEPISKVVNIDDMT